MAHIAAGQIAVAVSADGQAKVWARPTRGQLFEEESGRPVDLECAPLRAAAVGASYAHGIGVDGALWAWRWGQPPERLAAPTNVQAVAVGQWHSLVLDKGGRVWQLDAIGNKTAEGKVRVAPSAVKLSELEPVLQRSLTDVTAVAAGGAYSLALRRDGTVWHWGRLKALRGSGIVIDTPEQITGLSDVVGIACGDSHALAVDAKGAVWAWGDNTLRQHGPQTPSQDLVKEPVQVAGLPKIKAVAAGWHKSLALDGEGSVWQWGTGYMGRAVRPAEQQLSQGPHKVAELPPVTAVAVFGSYALALTKDGQLWAWGETEPRLRRPHKPPRLR